MKKNTKYIIKKGDTFWGLEKQHGLTHGTLTELNPNIDPKKLQIGHEINFPVTIDAPKDTPKDTPKVDKRETINTKSIVEAANKVIETYIKNNVKYSQPKREFGLSAKYSDCSATVNTILVECGYVDKLRSTHTAAMRNEIRDKGGEFRKKNPKPSDIMMWGGHVTIVTKIEGNSLYFAHMGNSGPRIGRVTLSNNELKDENVWGSGGFIGFWTIK